MAALARDSSKFQAAAPFYGIYDWVAAYGDADRLGKIFLVTGFDNYTPIENPELYARNSTVNYLDSINTPLLIEHGELDRRAPYSQALRITDALKNQTKRLSSFIIRMKCMAFTILRTTWTPTHAWKNGSISICINLVSRLITHGHSDTGSARAISGNILNVLKHVWNR